MAAVTGFYKRKSDFTPETFFDLLLYCASYSSSVSLEQCVTVLSDSYGIDISKQGLNERYNREAVKYVKEVLKQAMEIELGYIFCNQILSQYNYVRIKDSTRFNVDDRLVEHFKGSGGKGAKISCVCIQYEYDIKSGKILDLAITAGIVNDATDAKETQCNINNKDLVIRDLGYYNLGILSSFHDKGAFFISRLNLSTSIFNIDTGDQISFKELYKEMSEKKIDSLETIVLVSKGAKMKLRLIVTLIPEKEYQKRIRKANKSNKEDGYNTSDDYKARARFNMFITNIQNDVLPKDEILELYKLRWQIELVFKTWKSICAIDKIQAMKYERFVSILMAKLILIVMKLKIYWNIKNYYYNQKGKILSTYKCFKTFEGTYQLLREIIKANKQKSEENIEKYIKMFSKNHWKEKRKNKVGYEEIVSLFICNSSNYNYIEPTKKGAA